MGQPGGYWWFWNQAMSKPPHAGTACGAPAMVGSFDLPSQEWLGNGIGGDEILVEE